MQIFKLTATCSSFAWTDNDSSKTTFKNAKDTVQLSMMRFRYVCADNKLNLKETDGKLEYSTAFSPMSQYYLPPDVARLDGESYKLRLSCGGGKAKTIGVDTTLS